MQPGEINGCRLRRPGFDGSVALDRFLGKLGQYCATALHAAGGNIDHRLGQAAVHFINQGLGTPVRHTQRARRCRNRTGCGNGFEQGDFARADDNQVTLADA